MAKELFDLVLARSLLRKKLQLSARSNRVQRGVPVLIP